MRVAFLIQAHTNVPQINLLSEALERLGGRVYLHFDGKSTEPLDGLRPSVRQVKRHAVYHGGFSQVVATLELLHEAAADGHDRYFLLSGQCFPIKPAAWLRERMAADVDYINMYPMPCDLLHKRLDRLQHHHFERHSASTVHRLMNRLAARLPKRDFVNGMSMWPHAGSQWWCLRHSTATYVLDYVRRMPAFVRFMKTTSYPDEVFFQSILSNLGPSHQRRPALFHAEFAENGHPRVFSLADVGMLDATEAMFARKFDLKNSPDLLQHYFSRLA